MKRLSVPLAAALVGSAILLWLGPRVNPTASWRFKYGRMGAIARARDMGASLGVPVAGWKAYVNQEHDSKLERYQGLHPEDAATQSFSPQWVNVVFESPDGKRGLGIDLRPDGRLSGWERNETQDATQAPVNAAQFLADAAFKRIAGAEAHRYHRITNGAPAKNGLRYTWELTTASGAFQPSVDVIVKYGVVVHAETHLNFSNSFNTKDIDGEAWSDWFELAYFVLYFVMALMAAVIYTIGSLRRKIDQRFAIVLGSVNILFVAAAIWFGPSLDQFHINQTLQNQSPASSYIGVGYKLITSLLLAVLVAGAGFFLAGRLRPKWGSLRSALSGSGLWSRSVGLSLCVGALWSPLLAAVPLLATAAFSHPQWDLPNQIQLFNSAPVFQTLDYPLHPTALCFFGVLMGFVINRLPSRWWQLLIFVPATVMLFTRYGNLLRHPAGAQILEGALMAAAVFELLRRFDFLALITAETGLLVLTVAQAAFLQPSAALHGLGWRLLAVLGFLLSSGLVLLWKAPAGDTDTETSIEPLRGRSEREELKSEFTIAQRAQREMLPSEPPKVPGFSLAASCTPAREVGGDLYDFLPLAGDRLAIAVADVSGKGVPAALYMTLTKGLLAATTQENLELPLILDNINGHLYTVGGRKIFVTMALGILDPGDRTLEYARAGHNPVVWRRRSAQSTALLSSGGMGLGITGGKLFGRSLAVEKLQLESGDTLVFYSDGLTEAMNPALEEFGEERLMAAVERLDDVPASEVRDSLLADVAKFLEGQHPQDDLTLVVLRVD